jgi:hypothetical protein
MDGTRTLPAIGAIQRTNAIVACAAALLLFAFRSDASALSCLLGAGVVILNIFLLTLLVRVLLARAAEGSSSIWSAIALPAKLLLFVGLVYLTLFRSGIDGIGFGVGVFTQMIAVLIETARANLSQHRVSPGRA